MKLPVRVAVAVAATEMFAVPAMSANLNCPLPVKSAGGVPVWTPPC